MFFAIETVRKSSKQRGLDEKQLSMRMPFVGGSLLASAWAAATVSILGQSLCSHQVCEYANVTTRQ